MSGNVIAASTSDRPVVIVGSTGQDGYYLARDLRAAGRIVHGIGRAALYRHGTPRGTPFSLSDRRAVDAFLEEQRPAELYYLAAHHQSSQQRVADPAQTMRHCFSAHVDGLAGMLEGMRRFSPATRVFYAASAHAFGNPSSSPQSEDTPFLPVNPYGMTKAVGIQLCRMYRREHGLFCATGILYNHESPRKQDHFIGRKIVKAAVRIAQGRQSRLVIGDRSAKIDWGAAQDYVTAMAATLRLDRADDFIIASGVLHSIDEFLTIAFAAVGLDPARYVDSDPALVAARVGGVPLQGDISKLTAATGWAPARSFEEMIRDMVEAERGAVD